MRIFRGRCRDMRRVAGNAEASSRILQGAVHEIHLVDKTDTIDKSAATVAARHWDQP